MAYPHWRGLCGTVTILRYLNLNTFTSRNFESVPWSWSEPLIWEKLCDSQASKRVCRCPQWRKSWRYHQKTTETRRKKKTQKQNGNSWQFNKQCIKDPDSLVWDRGDLLRHLWENAYDWWVNVKLLPRQCWISLYFSSRICILPHTPTSQPPPQLLPF